MSKYRLIKAVDVTDYGNCYPKDVSKIVSRCVQHAKTVNAIPIPEGATNGDVFLNCNKDAHVLYDDGIRVAVILVQGDEDGSPCAMFSADWWNAPYKKVGGENDTN